jgi:hypothetical protein
MLQNDEISEAMLARKEKREGVFADLPLLKNKIGDDL